MPGRPCPIIGVIIGVRGGAETSPFRRSGLPTNIEPDSGSPGLRSEIPGGNNLLCPLAGIIYVIRLRLMRNAIIQYSLNTRALQVRSGALLILMFEEIESAGHCLASMPEGDGLYLY
jgi:hypothetical protein